MNQSSIEQQITSLTPPLDDLSTPHFDDSAVATAHQVEPLPKRGRIRSESSRAMTITAAVILGVLLGISAVIFSSTTHTDSATSAVAEEASAEMDSLDQSATQARTSVTSITREKTRARLPRIHVQRAMDRDMAEKFSEDDKYNSSRRTARKVAVIYYGRSRSEQP